ncbi:MAG TPA: roadblock/LC7 domain-containing protein [Gemmatimonadales bacterium]|nr:roadblock/LC7 domain-containing protein [Gemmatimonadales bacterium]
MSTPAEALDRVNAVRGIRGAMVVSLGDGLVVAESMMTGLDGRAAAALAASLAARLRRALEVAGRRPPAFVQLHGEGGSLLAVPCGDELLLVAIAGPEANVGLARLELIATAGALAAGSLA